jgi:cytoskeleton-associated protein 5
MTAVYAIKEMIRLFGAPVVNLKPILKSIPKIFDHKDKQVRQMVTFVVL